MKKMIKKIIACLCFMSMVLACFSGFISNKEVQAAESEAKPAYFANRIDMTLKNFGNGSVSSLPDGRYDASNKPARCWHTGGPKNFNGYVFSVKVKFLKGSEGTNFKIAGNGDQSDGLSIFVSSDGQELYLKDQIQAVNNRMVQSEKYMATYTAQDAGVSSFLNTEFYLQMTFDHGDFDGDSETNDVKIGMYFNGQLYKNEVTQINDCNISNFQRALKFQLDGEDSAIELYSVIPEPTMEAKYLSGFDHVTMSDYSSESGIQFQDGFYDSSATDQYFVLNSGKTNLNKMVLSMIVQFKANSINNAISIAKSNSGHDSFAVYVDNNNSNKLAMRNFAGLSMPNNDRMLYDSSVAGLNTFINKPFMLQLSFEFIDGDSDGNYNDLEIGTYFNGELYNNSKMVIKNTDPASWGTGFGFRYWGSSTKGVTFKSVNPKASETTPVTLDGFTHLSLNQFTNGNSLTGGVYKESNRYWSGIDFLNKQLFSVRVKFYKGDSGTNFKVAGKGSGTVTDGLAVYVSADGTELYLADLNQTVRMVQKANYKSVYKASEAGVSSFLNTEFLLQMSFEKGDFDGDSGEDDVKIGMYFNGKLYQNQVTTIYNCNIGNFSHNFRFAFDGTADSKIEMYPVNPSTEVAPAYVEGFEHVTLRDFGNNNHTDGMENGVYNKDNTESDYWLLEDPSAIDKKVISFKITFDDTGVNHGLYLAHRQGYTWWIYPNNAGTEMYLRTPNRDLNGTAGKQVTFLSSAAGVNSFVNEEIILQLSFEVGDFDSDSEANDMRIGMYINGKLCKNTAGKDLSVIPDCNTSILGAHLAIRNEGSVSEIKLGSVDVETTIDLAEGVYAYADGGNVTVNGEKQAGAYINKPGDYTLLVGTEEIAKKVVTYSKGDVNIDATFDIKDLVAGKKAVLAKPEKRAAQLGADMDGSGKIDENDVNHIRTYLVQGTYGGLTYLGQSVMPVAGYFGPSDSTVEEVFPETGLVTDEIFRMISDMGINLISYTSLDYNTNPSKVQTYMDLAHKNRIGVFVTDNAVLAQKGGSSVNGNAVAKQIEKYRNHPAFCGMYLVDEPDTTYYDKPVNNGTISEYGQLAKILQDDLNLYCYSNMLGGAVASERAAYEQYVQEFCDTIQPKILMWDHYVFDSGNTKETYFWNMNLIRKHAEEMDIPFWAFVQAGTNWHTSTGSQTAYTPNKAEFDWNVNTCLAFGAKGIQYFPLIQPSSFYTVDNDARKNGLIGMDGSKNQWYDYARSINKQIAAIDGVLMNSVNEGIILQGTTANADVTEKDFVIASGQYNELTSVSGDAMVGCFDYQGKTALYVVNYSTTQTQNITLGFNGTYNLQKVQNASSSSMRDSGVTLNMAAGEGVLLVLE